MNGTLLINKPEGWTSHDVVAKLRRMVGTSRIGHAGTLDPFATGVLVICVGVATRLVQFLVGLDKQYQATVRLGFATDTQDYTGKPITPVISSKGVTVEDVKRVLNDFTGEQLQLPPMFSAKKIDGQRLHKAARAGREVERQPVGINVYSIEFVHEGIFTEGADGTKDFTMFIHCSSGTYIRTLAHDIGARLGVGAHLSALHRTAVGQFEVSRAFSLNEVEEKQSAGWMEGELISLAETVSHFPVLSLNTEKVREVSNGRELILIEEEKKALIDSLAKVSQPYVRLCNQQGELVAIGEFQGVWGNLKPKVVFVSPGN
jgi:tRNA pseudouridine55 synthase